MSGIDFSRLRDLAVRLVASGPKAAHVSASECHEISDGLIEALAEVDQARVEIARLDRLLNTPLTTDFFEAVRNEAGHQIERWGVEHDAGKRPEDWISLVVYLLGKATKAHYDNDRAKLLHHVITVAAVCLNWHRAITGESNLMRPGVGS